MTKTVCDHCGKTVDPNTSDNAIRVFTINDPCGNLNRTFELCLACYARLIKFFEGEGEV